MPTTFDGDALLHDLLLMLRAGAVPGRAERERAYLKSDLEFLGAPVPVTRAAIARLLRSHPHLQRSELLSLADRLWREQIHECRLAAILLLACRVALLEERDIAIVEQFARESRTWALLDVLATDVAGPLVEAHPDLRRQLDRWATDGDFWVRRAAMLALLRPLRTGDGDWDRFTRYADAMLEDREFFIRKAIGWVLRDVSKKRPQLVFEWLLPRAKRASGVTIREAVLHLPADQREAVLAAYRSPP